MRGEWIGIIKNETGIQPYTEAQIDEGLRLACIQPPAKPVVTVTKGATVTAGIAAAGAAIEQLSPALPLLQTALEYAPMVVVAAMLLGAARSEEHTSELQSLMRISYAVFCLKKKRNNTKSSHRRTLP